MTMLVVASLLLLASALMRITSVALAMFAAAIAAQAGFGRELLGSGLCAALACVALWAETALALVHVGLLRGMAPTAEGQMGAGIGLAIASFFCLVGVPWAVLLVPLLTAVACAAAVVFKRRDPRMAGMAVMALMTDRGECRYVRGIMAMILVAFLLRRLAGGALA
ncbi:MAG: hypothetical protein HY816_00895 [Candidatus Wallbacteria bacterium]|nr:hypothetical protein [Candidatus Wallbacteria bacterium]